MTTGPWLTAAKLAGLRLVGVPASPRRAHDWLQRLRAPSRKAQGQQGGGGIEWDCSALPKAVRDQLVARQLATATPALMPSPAPAPAANLPAVAAAARVPSRTDAACADARLGLLNHLYTLADNGVGITRATQQLAAQLDTRSASPDVLGRAVVANQRAAKANPSAVSARTLLRWHTDHAARGWAGLLPATVAAKPLAALADDVAAVLARYHSASGAARNLSHCAQAVNVEMGRPYDDWKALAHRARRALPKLPKIDLIKARHTGAERDQKLPYKRRDTSVLVPNDVWLIDGHSFKAKVRHPEHGQPFAPEVTAVIDAADRYIVGWSVSLSENMIAVGDAVRHAITYSRVPPAMIYSDGGSGETGKVLDCPITGIYDRLGISHPIGLPGKPQGHGLIERSWQTTMIRCARQFGSYQGGDADSHTVRNVRLELGREATAIKRAQADGTLVKLSAKVPSWQQFIQSVAEEVQRYNTLHRHRSLPKHTSGAHTGKHMTPAEARAAMAEPADESLQLDDLTIGHLFRPATMRTPSRGWVRLLNQHYYSEELMAHGVDNTPCSVHYDIHDASRVWVWTVQGQFVCEAKLDGNGMDYMPKPAIELAREKRVRAAVKRLETKIATAHAELAPQIEATPAGNGMVFAAPQRGAELQHVERVDQAGSTASAATAPGRPLFFASSAERYEWLMQHRAAWADGDEAWLADYAQGHDYEALAGYFSSRGIAWAPEGDSPDIPGFSQAG